MEPIPVLILGAAGRDFHDFLTRFRDDASRRVVAFTAAQIPYITDRAFPSVLAGPLYPEDIPIRDESELERLIHAHGVREVCFSYSDVPYARVMSLASRAQAAGARFVLPDPQSAMLEADRPVLSVCAVRTGCGKSQIARALADVLAARGLRAAVVRHPMPYGDLAAQRCQRFAAREDLSRHRCTVEEREEYEPHLEAGHTVFAGVDYAAILAAAQAEADVILWDGGNNDLPFFRPDLHLVVADALRPGHERLYYPGETNARLADVFVINKVDAAEPEDVSAVERSLYALNPSAEILWAESPVTVERPEELAGRRVLCVEDGPTLTHGGMAFGAAVAAARTHGATPVDPRPWLSGEMRRTFEEYPGIGPLLPAMGYSDAQLADLAATINRTECDLVLAGTPIDLAGLISVDRPVRRAHYRFQHRSGPTPEQLVDRLLAVHAKRKAL